MNKPFVVFNARARAEVLISIENIEVRMLNTDPTQAPNAILIRIINKDNKKLFSEMKIK